MAERSKVDGVRDLVYVSKELLQKKDFDVCLGLQTDILKCALRALEHLHPGGGDKNNPYDVNIAKKLVDEIAARYRGWFDEQVRSGITVEAFFSTYATIDQASHVDLIFDELYPGQTIEGFVQTWLNVGEETSVVESGVRTVLTEQDAQTIVKGLDQEDAA